MSKETLDLFLAVTAIASIAMLALNILLAPLLRALASFRGDPVHASAAPVRKVSILVPAFNEEGHIGAKIDSLRAALANVDPAVEVEVLIGSDGSTDRTNEIAKARIGAVPSPQWRLFEYPNAGKCATLNRLLDESRGELIVCTDADVLVPADAIAIAVHAFSADARLGCASCIPCFAGQEIGSQGRYWRVEDEIRKAESALGMLIVVSGMFCAFRRQAFTPIPAGVMADDLWIPLSALLAGHDCRQLDGLVVPYEKTDEETEVKRRRRVIVGGMDVVRRLAPRLVSVPRLLLLVLVHKVNRWAFPAWAMLLAIACAVLLPWLIAAYLAFALVALAALGWKRFSVLALAVASPALALMEAMRSSDLSRWNHTRKH